MAASEAENLTGGTDLISVDDGPGCGNFVKSVDTGRVRKKNGSTRNGVRVVPKQGLASARNQRGCLDMVKVSLVWGFAIRKRPSVPRRTGLKDREVLLRRKEKEKREGSGLLGGYKIPGSRVTVKVRVG